MDKQIAKNNEVFACTNCITGLTEQLVFGNGILTSIIETAITGDGRLFVGPGLIDLQINGINGIDFNNPSLTQQEVVHATHYLLSKGITSFLPTVITNSDDSIKTIVRTISSACESDSLVNDCIWGIHLEGPFISRADGARGAHDQQYIKAPDWELFKKFQQAAGGKIKLVTIAPEWEGTKSFIKNCRREGILVSIGHSMANSEQVETAVKAGASLSTHLGNGVPLHLQRHPNIIWDQLAAEELYACIITDGIHIPDSFIKVVIKNKGSNAIVVSDATCFAGMPPGEYQNHIGGTVILDKEKRISLKSSPGLLAGAAKSLLENVESLVNRNISTLGEAWQMASINITNMLSKNDASFIDKNDVVIFKIVEKEIMIKRVIKGGRIVFEQ